MILHLEDLLPCHLPFCLSLVLYLSSYIELWEKRWSGSSLSQIQFSVLSILLFIFPLENPVFHLKVSSPESGFFLCRDKLWNTLNLQHSVLLHILNMQFWIYSFKKLLVTNVYRFGSLSLLLLLVKWIFSYVWRIFTFEGRRGRRVYLF